MPGFHPEPIPPHNEYHEIEELHGHVSHEVHTEKPEDAWLAVGIMLVGIFVIAGIIGIISSVFVFIKDRIKVILKKLL